MEKIIKIIYVFTVISIRHFSMAFTQNDFDIFPELPLGVFEVENFECKKHSDLFVQSLKNYTLWAYEMWDSTAKSTTGILRGNMFQMGHFEQCLTSKAPFETKYCLVNLKANIPELENPNRDLLSIDFNADDSVMDRLYRYKDLTKQPRDTVNLGWCIPASCSSNDLRKSLQKYFNNITNTALIQKNVTYKANIIEDFCQDASERQSFKPADYVFCGVASILILVTLISTFCDYWNGLKKQKSEDKTKIKYSLGQKMWLAFSAKRNFKEMTNKENSNKELDILYGLRTLAICYIIMDHRFGTFTSSALINFDYVEKQYRAPFACVVFHGDLFVDTFFIISGLLVTYGLLTQFDRRMINPGFIIFLRYVRLTPVYAFVIFYYATIFDYTGNGPLWKVIAGADSTDCKNNWWTNLLYINNYINADHMCMTHAWYLPCDFHYFIIAIGLCILIKKEKKIGLSALLSVTLTSVIIPFILTVVYRRPAMLMFYPDFLTGPKIHPDFLLTYSKSHTRATPYLIGMFAGYVHYKLKGKEYHICKIKSAIIIIVSLVFIATSIFAGAVFYNPYHPYNSYESASYAAFHRVLWALGSIGIMHVMSYGHGSFMRKMLTWKPWVPLSKLQYGAYLIHMQFQLRAAAKFMNSKYISYFDVISLSLSDMVLSFMAALILYLTIEAPFRKIFKELLMPKREPKPGKSELQTNTNNNNNTHINNNNNDNGHVNKAFKHETSVEDSRL